jgi:hypothetical protein
VEDGECRKTENRKAGRWRSIAVEGGGAWVRKMGRIEGEGKGEKEIEKRSRFMNSAFSSDPQAVHTAPKEHMWPSRGNSLSKAVRSGIR